MIALLDYGAGNVRSVQKALTAAGGDVQLAPNPDTVAQADAVVLPGVGAFDDCINAMQRQELFEAARAFVSTGKPFLGICIGYQALFEKSEEFNSCAAGLGIFEGSVVRFPDAEVKVPQIGWNEVQFSKPDCPILQGIESGSHFISCTVIIRSRKMNPSWPPARNMAWTSPRRYGATTCLPPSFIPKRARKWASNCSLNFVNLI